MTTANAATNDQRTGLALSCERTRMVFDNIHLVLVVCLSTSLFYLSTLLNATCLSKNPAPCGYRNEHGL